MQDETSSEANQPQRERPNIPTERLYACLRDQYALDPMTLTFLPRGRDYDAGVFRVETERGAGYFLKVTTRPLYPPSCLAPHYLSEQGITSVVAPLPTTSGALWATLGEWRATVYPFIEGDTSWAGMSRAQWREVGSIFKRIHALRPSPERLEGLGPLRRETFDPSSYRHSVQAFEEDQLTQTDGSESVRALRAAWVAHAPAIHAALISLEALAATLRSRELPAVICHADLHPANLLRDAAGRVFVIDWDEVMLAPVERDFIFVREPPADAFWDGYGDHAIDWVALTYFQYERALQDVIEDARQACSRDDLSEAVKRDVVTTFEQTFAEGNNLEAAYAAAAHLPPELGLS